MTQVVKCSCDWCRRTERKYRILRAAVLAVLAIALACGAWELMR